MRIGIVYGYVSSNLGDLAINQGVAGLIRRLAPDAEVHVVFRNPNEDSLGAAKAAFEEIERLSFGVLRTKDTRGSDVSGDYVELERAADYVLHPDRFITDAGLSGCDVVLYNSGEHIFAYEGSDNHVDLVWRVLPALAAKAAGMRFVTLPATVGPFEAPAIEGMLRAFFTLNDAIAVRDARSTHFAAKFLNGSSPPVLLDPTFFASVPQASDYNDNGTLGLVMRLENFGLRVGKKRSSVTLANYKERGFGESRAFRFAVAAGRSFLDKAGGRINLFIQNPSDSDLTTAIAHALAEQGYSNRLRVIQPASVSEYQEELGRASFIVASRFHACILGLLSGIAVMGVHFDEHGHKMPGLFDLLEVPDYCRNLSRTSPESLAASVVPLFLERGHAFAEMAGRLQSRQHDTQEWFQAGLRASEARSPVQRDIAGLSLAYITGIEAIRSRAIADMMQTKLGAAREAAKHLKSELESTKQKLTEAEQLNNQSKTEAQHLKSELEATKQKLIKETEQLKNQSKTEAQQLKSELEATKQKLIKETGAKDKATQNFIRTRETLEKLRSSFSYQLGSILTQSVRKPGRNTILLPYRLLPLIRRGFRRLRERRGSRPGQSKVKTDVHVEKPSDVEQAIRVGTVDKGLADKVLGIFTAQGIQNASRYIQECKAPNAEKANLFEYLLDLGLTADPKDAAPLLVEAFKLDPTYARGKRLANWGFAQGLISHPAAIITQISQMKEWQPSVDTPLAEQIFGWNHIKEKLPEIPPRKTITEIDGRGRTALMLLFCSLPHHSNGYAIRSHGLLSGLKKSSWDVITCTRPGYPWDVKCHTTPDQSGFAQVDGIFYRHLKGLNRQKMAVDDYFDESANIIEAVAKTIRPSVIHAASNHVTALPALIAARRLGLPFIYEVRGLWEVTQASTKSNWDDTELFQLQHKLESLVAREADCVITLTDGLRDELISRGVQKENIRIVPNCVDAQRFKPLPRKTDLHRKLGLSDAPTIGYVGSFVAYEGLDDLVRAAVILKRKGIRFNLLLVGDGNALNEIRELIRNSDLKQEVFVTGRIPYQEVEHYYSLIDIAPFPRKPLPVCEMVSPLKPFEAMAMGKVVVGSSVNGLKEIVTHGETGLIFEKGNIGDLAEKLAQVITDRNLAIMLGTNGQRWVCEQRSWDSAAQKIAAIYKEILSETSRRFTSYPAQADKLAALRGSLRLAVYADVNLNIIDGSSIWTVTLAEALAGLEHAEVFLFLKSQEKRDLLTGPLRKFSNVTIISPTEADGIVGGRLSPEAALDKVEAMDRQLAFDAIFLRRFALCEKASLRSSFRGRLWTYVTDIPRKSEELTPDIVHKLEDIAKASKYILCQTEEIRSHWVRYVPSAQARTKILPVIIPAPNLREGISYVAPKVVRRICYAGKFDPIWGTVEMFKAFVSLRAIHPEVELHIFGDKIHNPPEMPDFQRTVQSYLKNTEGVVWHRGLSREQVLKHMEEMDIGWAWRCPELESNTLELSTKILEYGSYGLPVILYRNAINERLLGSDYPLFANTYDELVALLHRLPNSPDILTIASSRTRSASEEFTIDVVRDKYIRPLFSEVSAPEISIRPAERASVLVAGHDLKFINGLCRRFPENGYAVETDNWWGHNNHEIVASEQLLEKAAIVICEWCLANAVWYSQNKRPGQKLVIRFHRQEIETEFPRSVNMKNVDKIVFIAPHVKRKAISRYGWKSCEEEKLILIPNYVDLDLFNIPKDPEAQFNIGICGFVPSMKRLDRALDIIEKLRQDDQRFHLYAKGKMPQEYRWMQQRYEELRYYEGVMDRIKNSQLLKEAVHFDGWGDDMPQWYQKIGFILSTSDFEGSHVIVAEGAASKAVPILLKWEGADEVYPEDWSCKTIDEAAGAILDIIKTDRFKEVAESRYSYVKENFAIEHIFQSWREMLASL